MSLRTSLILLLLLALVAGYLVLNKLHPPPQEGQRITRFFYALSDADINQVTVFSQGKEYTFVQGATRADWYFEDAHKTPVDIDRWAGTTLLLSGPGTNRLLFEQVEDLAPYGLADPQGRISIRAKGNRELNVLLGNTTEDGANHYAKLEGSPEVYLVDSSWGDVLAAMVTRPPYPQWYFQGPADLVDQIDVTYRGAKVAFIQDSDRGWQFNTSDDAELRPSVDTQRWDTEVISLLAGPTLQYQAAPDLKGTDAYGLHNPTAVIRIQFLGIVSTEEGNVPAFRSLEWDIGRKTEDGQGYYAKLLGFPPLVVVDTHWVEGLTAIAQNPPHAPAAGRPSS
ncbi:MAG: DUF4340 domain-containing protein [Dehalococcoidia bacterium]|nr:DUF4340 domain-containing protein [Dehalococcoidia bacterium]